jgi:hypothetical protein
VSSAAVSTRMSCVVVVTAAFLRPASHTAGTSEPDNNRETGYSQ